MRLTAFSDYALRVLIYLSLKTDRKSTIREISDRYGISKNHLMKVVSLLTRAGFVDSTRGPGGGLALAQAPQDIRVGDVIRQTEDDLALVECFRQDNRCVITPVCELVGMIDEALKAFVDVLDRYTLADVVSNREGLVRVLLLDRQIDS
jgi:Rrf2 family nitric oxide-sensitive transcriptional repressor